jgi:hypothetical protein
MTFSTETIGRLYASGRNYINSGLGLLTGIGLMSAAQNKGLTDSLTEIYNGVSQIVHGATSAWQIIAVVAAPILTPIIARWASKSATVDSQAAAVQTAAKDPNTVVSQVAKASMLDAVAETAPLAKPIVIKDAALAAAVPSDKVVTQ